MKGRQHGLNRTNVELKRIKGRGKMLYGAGLNRTNVELKRGYLAAEVKQVVRLNRTNVELKRHREETARQARPVLIEPMWN